MPHDLITLYCQGEGQRFHGKSCEHLDAEAKTCRLLRDFELRTIFEQGRCAPYDMLKRAIARHLEKYRDVVDPAEYLEAMTFEAALRLHPKRLTQGHELYVLQGYINRTAYCSVIEMLQREHPIVKRECGACRYLSPARPHHCGRATFLDNDGEQTNPYYDTPRNATDRACQHGFEALETTALDDVAEPPPALIAPPADSTSLLLHDMLNVLAKRPDAEGDPRLKRRYERQYVIFARLLDLFRQGYLQQEALSMIAQTLAVSAKTIERELSEMKEFFAQAGVF